MDTIVCRCKKCDSEIGEIINLWTQVGKSYVSPVIEPDEDPAVLSHGAVRVGERGSLVEECHLQDIVCANCTFLLGIKFIATPINHLLDENQIMLKLAAVTLSDEDGGHVKFVIKRVLDLREPSRVNSTGSFPASFPSNGGFSPQTYTQIVDVFKLQSDLEVQRQDISRIDSNGFKIVSALDNRVVSVEHELKKLSDTLDDARRAIGIAQEDVKSAKAETVDVKRLVENRRSTTGLEERLDSVTSALGEVRQEVSNLAGQYKSELAELKRELTKNKQGTENLKSQIKGSVSSRRHTKDMAAVLAELAQLRQDMDNSPSRRPSEQINTPFPSRELEILTSSIAKIGSRASQVETLRMEFEIMKGRVERVEATTTRQNSTPDTHQSNLTASARPASPPRRVKRTSSVVEAVAVAGQNPPVKRPKTSSGYLKTPARSHHTSLDPQESTPTIKLTKSGNID